MYPLEMIDKFKICEDINVCLGQLDQNSRLAVAISRERDLNSIIETSSEFCFEKSETIHEYPMTLFVRRDFLYLENLNRFIQMASECGLIEKWHIDSQIQSHYKSNENIYKHLTLDNFRGIYIIWCIILLIDFFVLLLERFIHRKARMPNPSRFWIIVEMFIDSDRHFWVENKWT